LYEAVARTFTPPGPASEKLALVTVVGSSGWSNDARTLTLGLTPVVPPLGNVEVTLGACVWCVVNDQVNGVPSGVPSAALTVAAICAL
jgi:hypothetical protein